MEKGDGREIGLMGVFKKKGIWGVEREKVVGKKMRKLGIEGW